MMQLLESSGGARKQPLCRHLGAQASAGSFCRLPLWLTPSVAGSRQTRTLGALRAPH